MKASAAMPKYETYKNSGIEWLGEIPDSWKVSRLKYLFLEINERSQNGNEELLSVSQYTGVTKKSDKVNDGDLITNAETLEGYKKVKKGDLVSNIMLAWNGSLAFSSFDGITSPAYSVYRLKEGFISSYFHYLLRTDLYKAEYKRKSSGVIESRLRLYTDDFYDVWGLIPSLEEQTAIAHFLDQKTAQIDAAIAIKEQQIALLKERKQILIQQAVTRGVGFDFADFDSAQSPQPTGSDRSLSGVEGNSVPMKDSGAEWIGEIPAHWKYTKIKYCIDILPGYAFKSEEYTHNEGDIRLLRGINVNTSQIKWDDVVYWSADKLYDLDKYKLQLGDLVIGMDRPWVSTGIRVAQVQKNDVPSLLLQRVARIRGKNSVLTNYVKQLLSTQLFVSYFELLLTGISVPHISTDQIEDFECPIPTPSEQEKILAYINDESKKIDDAVMLQQQQIEKLREYKTTLINSAVTGKIKIV